MKSLTLFIFLCVTTGWTQSVPPPSAPKGDTVLAIFDDGAKMTVAEFQALLPGLPQAFQQMAMQDSERFFRNYAVIRKAALVAESKKLAEKPPYKDTLAQTLAFAKMYAMADYAVKDAMNSVTVDTAEIEKYYSDHKDIYKKVEVSAIKVAFGGMPDTSPAPANASRPAKKVLTEAEAKTKADKLVEQLRGGTPFATLLPQSDDENLRNKGGKVGFVKMTDNLPDLMRMTILSLEAGQVSSPVQQDGGFYIYRADEVVFIPLSEVRDSIFEQLKQDHANQWMENLMKSTKVDLPK